MTTYSDIFQDLDGLQLRGSKVCNIFYVKEHRELKELCMRILETIKSIYLGDEKSVIANKDEKQFVSNA